MSTHAAGHGHADDAAICGGLQPSVTSKYSLSLKVFNPENKKEFSVYTLRDVPVNV